MTNKTNDEMRKYVGMVPTRYSENPLFRKSIVQTRHSANIWVKVKVRVRISLRVSGNSILSE